MLPPLKLHTYLLHTTHCRMDFDITAYLRNEVNGDFTGTTGSADMQLPAQDRPVY